MFASALNPDERINVVGKIIPEGKAYGGVAVEVQGKEMIIVAQRAEGAGTWPVKFSIFTGKLIDSLKLTFSLGEDGVVSKCHNTEPTAANLDVFLRAAASPFAKKTTDQEIAHFINLRDDVEAVVTDFVQNVFDSMGGFKGMLDRLTGVFTAEAPDPIISRRICQDLNNRTVVAISGAEENFDQDGDPYVLFTSCKNGIMTLSAGHSSDESMSHIDLNSLNIELLDKHGKPVEWLPGNIGRLEFEVQEGQTYTFKAEF